VSVVQAVAFDPGYPGAGRVLRELSKVFPSVSYFGQGTNFIPSHEPFLFLPAWNPGYSALLKGITSKVVIVWTSPLLQTEMVPQELEYVAEIRRFLDLGKIHAVWCGHPNTVDLFKGKGFHAPYPVALPPEKRGRIVPPIIRLSLFGPMHPRKNVLAQAMAFRMLMMGKQLLTSTSRTARLFPSWQQRAYPWEKTTGRRAGSATTAGSRR
jgi:hypothetical protein